MDNFTLNDPTFKNKNIRDNTFFGNLYFKQHNVAEKIQISHHYKGHKNIVMLKNGDLFTVLKVGGISYFTEDQRSLRSFNVRFHNWIRAIADENLIIHSHLIRYRTKLSYNKPSTSVFGQYLDDKYLNKINENDLYRNELFIGLQMKPDFSNMGFFSGLVKAFDKAAYYEQIEEARKKLEDKIITTKSYLGVTKDLSDKEVKTFDFRILHLGTYEENGVKFSEVGEFESLLLNNKRSKVPMKSSTLANALSTTKVAFVKDAFEVDPINRDKFVGAVLGIKEYPFEVGNKGDILDKFLTLPFELSISQSFKVMARQKALGAVRTRLRKMSQAEDVGYDEQEQLEQGQQYIQNGRIWLGEHNLNAFIYAKNNKELKKNVAEASAVLAESGGVINRETFANEAAFWARFAGNENYAPRPTILPSHAFSCFSSMHTFPSGQIGGNKWGSALTLMKSNGNSPYFFNWHVNDIGNAIIIGPTGSGKTVFQGFVIAQTEKLGIRTIFIDKDRGGEIMCRALGGSYETLIMGQASGFAPLKVFMNYKNNMSWLYKIIPTLGIEEEDLELIPKGEFKDFEEFFNSIEDETLFKKVRDKVLRKLKDSEAEDLLWLCQFIELLITSESNRLTAIQREKITEAIKLTVSLPIEDRNFSSLIVQLNDNELKSALSEWSKGNIHGWLFDNDEDTFLSENRLFGFDVTSILEDTKISAVFTMYLFKRIEEFIDGNPIQIIFDEFWKSLANEDVAKFINDKLKVIRKQNGAVIGGTQSAADVLNSPIAHSIVEQCKTKIYFPNSSGERKHYIDGLGCTEREFELLTEELIGTRSFLVKKDNYSVVVDLDLGGLDGALKVLSGRTETLNELNKLMANLDSKDPNMWLSEFIELD